ncbi:MULTISPECIES: hypothetical protein [unclassified Caballeronia]|uniref:hypothetical protein n=1 Tax=unclassified Caballeronia TaxID=2646786 RepID=UPI0020278A02|nr:MULTISPECIES: hypothetical protein [unclassified Caballeronia]MDR5777269.1 hypothetical protein [Caballeronia sp. LZ002]MDR5802598.1 hypothetical protein [Caballeronia sp. LZ001]MDR5852707.1 hypothetical protein [Caballeronia sp. LZ003]
MKDDDVAWTKVQMFKAIRSYQVGLADISARADDFSEQLKEAGLTPEIRMFLDQIAGLVVSTTVEVAEVLDR